MRCVVGVETLEGLDELHGGVVVDGVRDVLAVDRDDGDVVVEFVVDRHAVPPMFRT